MQLSDFDYFLPEELIGQTPCEPRDHSRLMVMNKYDGNIEHKKFYDLLEYLQKGDTLVFNDTKVMPARLLGSKKGSGGKVEVFLLNRQKGDEWEVLVKPGKKARIGAKIVFGENLECEIIDNTDFGGRIAKFNYQGIFEEILDELGETPLPPYIKAHLNNKERYQTVYAKESGSAAAPTAGLHFTKELLNKCQAKGVNLAFVTLHVGLGTFRPVNVEEITEHKMHKEYYAVSQETAEIINTAKRNGNRVIAVGTTAIRTLESASTTDGLQAKSGWTDIFIYPGYQFKIVDAIITNFHLPKSTLLMLISAFAGKEKILQAYQEAIKEKYQFFSFGDAMFLYNQK